MKAKASELSSGAKFKNWQNKETSDALAVTITTVGYGDVTPVTGMGKLFTGLIALLALLAVAIPTGIVSAGFMEEFRRCSPGRCPHCGQVKNR